MQLAARVGVVAGKIVYNIVVLFFFCHLYKKLIICKDTKKSGKLQVLGCFFFSQRHGEHGVAQRKI
jgi:hypothetical protein